MTNDSIEISILEDGTLKIVTDPISAANHANAEQFLQFMARLAGGESTRVRRKDRLAHQHQHNHITEGGGQ